MSQPHSHNNQSESSECSKVNSSSINIDMSMSSQCNHDSNLNSKPISPSINTENIKCKSGMMVFHCRCSDTTPYCVQHMRPEEHECMFDHKEKGKEILRNNLPKIVSDKLVKI